MMLLITLSGCAVSPDSRLSLPFSERTDFIHAYEAINFEPVDKGEKNIILYYKAAPPKTLGQYHSFDTSVISQSNVVYRSINARRAAELMRGYIHNKLQQYNFRHTDKARSQAGIAVVISSYQKIPGRIIEELMLVVFDREKSRQLTENDPTLQGYRLLQEMAVWVGVVRHAPVRQIDISQGVHSMQDEDFQKMVDLLFENFMQDSQLIPLR